MIRSKEELLKLQEENGTLITNDEEALFYLAKNKDGELTEFFEKEINEILSSIPWKVKLKKHIRMIILKRRLWKKSKCL